MTEHFDFRAPDAFLAKAETKLKSGARSKMIKKLTVLLIVTLLLGAMPLMMPSVKAQPSAPAIWIEPATLNFNTTNTHVGDEFNVTVWASSASDVFVYQVSITYDPTMLNVTSVGYTHPPTSAWFAGHSTIPVTPTIDYADGSVLIGESLLGTDVVHASNGSICYITFQIIAAPSPGKTLTSLIDTNHTSDSYFLDPDLNIIPNVSLGHAAYAFSASVAPPPPTKHDVVVSNVSASNHVNQGEALPIDLVVLNNGTATETSVVVNATANGTLIGAQTVTSLGAGNSTTLTFNWNTTGIAAGTYTVTGTVTPVLNQTDLTGISKSVTVQVLTVSAAGQYYLNVSSDYDSPTPPSGLFNAGTSINESVTSPVSGGPGVQYVCTGWTGTGSVPVSGNGSSVTFTIYANSTITWNWKTQYQVTFKEFGVGSDFAATVLTIDGVNYTMSSLPVSFWWDNSSSHTFAFQLPLVLTASEQYSWLSSLQSGTLTVTASGSVIPNYVLETQLLFAVPLWFFFVVVIMGITIVGPFALSSLALTQTPNVSLSNLLIIIRQFYYAELRMSYSFG